MNEQTKHFKVEAHGTDYLKVTENLSHFDLYVFNYEKFKMMKDELKLFDNNGIYFIEKRTNENKLYIGQTSDGISRFNGHDFIRKSESKDQFKIYYFNLNRDRVNKNILDYVEKEVISEIGLKNLENKTKGNTSPIAIADHQYADDVFSKIKDYMLLFDFDLNRNKNSDSFYDETDHSINLRSGLSDVVEALAETIEQNEGITQQGIYDVMVVKFKYDLNNNRWESVDNFKAKIRQKLQIYTKSYDVNEYSEFRADKWIFSRYKNSDGEIKFRMKNKSE